MPPLRIAGQPEPCCAERCRYSAASVRRVLNLLSGRAWDKEAGRYYGCSADELEAVMNPSPGYDTDRLAGFGPSFGPTWTLYLADLDRARAAGCRTPDEIARYLCPFSDMGQDDLLEAA